MQHKMGGVLGFIHVVEGKLMICISKALTNVDGLEIWKKALPFWLYIGGVHEGCRVAMAGDSESGTISPVSTGESTLWWFRRGKLGSDRGLLMGLKSCKPCVPILQYTYTYIYSLSLSLSLNIYI